MKKTLILLASIFSLSLLSCNDNKKDYTSFYNSYTSDSFSSLSIDTIIKDSVVSIPKKEISTQERTSIQTKTYKPKKVNVNCGTTQCTGYTKQNRQCRRMVAGCSSRCYQH